MVKKVNGEKLVHIADFGGVRDVRILSRDEFTNFDYTPSYCTRSDRDIVESIKKLAWDATSQAKAIDLRKKMIVFSMGMILYEALSGGKQPYELGPGGFRNSKSQYKELDPSIPTEIRDLIKEMLSDSHSKRPYAANACNA